MIDQPMKQENEIAENYNKIPKLINDNNNIINQIKKLETNSQFCELKNIKMENGKIMDLNIIIEGEKEMADLKAW